MQFLLIVFLSIIVIILILVIICLVIHFGKVSLVNNMYKNVTTLLKKIQKEDKGNDLKIITPEKKSKRLTQTYDYILETKNNKYYIKVIPNFENHEICINNSVKWQIRRSINDNTMNFVQNIEGLMRFEANKQDEKKIRKLYIIYPSSKSLLRYINECEMEFVKKDTDVYGCNVVTYKQMYEEHNK